MLLAVIPLRD